jgi:predicted DNA binding CopG/RHH family protein
MRIGKKIDWSKIKLSPEEQQIEDEAHLYRPVSREEFLKVKEAIDQWKKDTVLNMRVNGEDVMLLRQKAEKLGLKYQTFIAQILHRVARS